VTFPPPADPSPPHPTQGSVSLSAALRSPRALPAPSTSNTNWSSGRDPHRAPDGLPEWDPDQGPPDPDVEPGDVAEEPSDPDEDGNA
jgi:hypothetical protein